jgi:hypothetical protein
VTLLSKLYNCLYSLRQSRRLSGRVSNGGHLLSEFAHSEADMISSLLTPHPVVHRIVCGSLLSKHSLISLLSKTNSLASTIFQIHSV